ncbi:MAG: DNA-binding protein [Burkholderiales bacterium]|nr:DNA-binding protein [Burkholderiales bacterium]
MHRGAAVTATGGENARIADELREAAALLQAQGANPYRIAAYRKAADTVARLDRPVREIFEEGGREGLDALPGVGAGIAAAIAEMVITGRWSQLERLRGSVEPEGLFQSVPGIGPELARAIHDTLHVDTLEALEAAAHDGRLEGVAGVGARRSAAIRAALASMLGRRLPRAGRPAAAPSVEAVLAVDDEYRTKDAAGKLPKIAPKRFNPTGEAWLPVLHAERGGRHFTALYSNTARAHELGRTRDWVVVYYYGDDHVEGQLTVVTETRGPLAGKRVVRGRERECLEHYGREGGVA